MFFHNSNESDLTVSVKDRSFEIPFATIDIKNNKIFNLEENLKTFFQCGYLYDKSKIIKRLIETTRELT